MEVEASTITNTASKYPNQNQEILNRVGYLTRALHENLKVLSLDKIIEHVANDIPDACERLNYVSCMTEQAAERVLSATEVAIPIQADIANRTQVLKAHWENTVNSNSLRSEYIESVKLTLDFLALTEKNSKETKVLLMDIMMAQDFQDLTGQVIKKVIRLTQELEHELMQALIDFSPSLKGSEQEESEFLTDQPIDDDVKSTSNINQDDLDNLLNDLGF